MLILQIAMKTTNALSIERKLARSLHKDNLTSALNVCFEYIWYIIILLEVIIRENAPMEASNIV